MRSRCAAIAGCVFAFVSSSSLQHFEEGAEATSMLQTAGRAGLRSRSSEALDALLLSATRMLREGATIDILSFADDTLKAIKGEVVPAMDRDHAAQQAMIWEHYKTVSDFLATHHVRTESLQQAQEVMSEKSRLHRSCRLEASSVTTVAVHCEEELSKVWDSVSEEEGDLEDIEESISTSWCTPGINLSLPMFRTVSERKFTHYTSKLLKIRTIWREYEEWLLSCHEKRSVSDGRRTDCDELQYELEAAACEASELHRAANNSLFDEWPLLARVYNETVASVERAELARKEEFSTVWVVECLLNQIRIRGGKPCDNEGEGPGNADEEIAKCKHTEVNTTHLDIEYPEEPTAPALGPAIPAPCSAEYLESQYGDLPDEAHVAECRPCSGDVAAAQAHAAPVVGR